MSPRIANALVLVALVHLGTPVAAATTESPTPAVAVSWDRSEVRSVVRGGVDLDAPIDHLSDADDPGDLRWEVFTNPAYQCQAEGDFWFVVVERVEDAPPRGADDTPEAPGRRGPLFVEFSGMNLGIYLPDGTSMPPGGVYADRPVGLPGADADPAEMDELSEAIRRGMSSGSLRTDLVADGWRWLSPGTCDTDAYTGLGTPYPNHPDPGQTVDGALASLAAIEHVTTAQEDLPAALADDSPLRPTDQVVLAGTSAGVIGAHAVAQTLRTTSRPDAPHGATVTGLILDSGIGSDRQIEIWTADDGLRLPPTLPSIEFLIALDEKLQHPTLDDASGHVERVVANGSDIPVLAVYDRSDAACGGGEGTPGLSTPEHPAAYDGDLCRYAFSGLVEATEDPRAAPQTVVHEYDVTDEGFKAHVLLSQPGHPAVVATRAWIDALVAEAGPTPMPYLPMHDLSQVSRDPWSDRSFVDAVSWAVDQEIVTGYQGAVCGQSSSPCFGPGRPVSRQALAAFLHRLSGTPDVGAGDTVFRDVSASHPFADAIRWMASSGLSTGYADGTFRPAAPVTRQASAALLHRFADSPPPAVGGPAFTDVSGDHPFAAAIRWMASSGISTGYADGTFRPAATVTRRAVVQFLHRVARQLELDQPA